MVHLAGGRSGGLPEGEDRFATESKIESAAAACVLWSTIGVGCLIGGRPKSSVSQQLDCCCNGRTIETGQHAAPYAFLLFLFQSNTEVQP